MLWRDTIKLIALTYSTNTIGDITETEVKKEVFANKKSIRQNEFYQAQAQGLRLELMFEVRTVDYSGEDILEFNNKTYKILRTYSKNDEIVELICNSLVGKG